MTEKITDNGLLPGCIPLRKWTPGGSGEQKIDLEPRNALETAKVTTILQNEVFFDILVERFYFCFVCGIQCAVIIFDLHAKVWIREILYWNMFLPEKNKFKICFKFLIEWIGEV